MGWTPRQTANNYNGLQTFEGFAGNGIDTYSGTGTWPNSCAVTNWAGIVAFKTTGPGATYIQGASAASAYNGSGFGTYSVVMPGNATAGNWMIVDIAFNTSTGLSGCLLTDSAGNFYWPVFGAHAAGSFNFVCTWIGKIANGGGSPLTIDISQQAGSSAFQAIAVCAHEYSGLAGALPPKGFSATSSGMSNAIFSSPANLFDPGLSGVNATYLGITYDAIGYINSNEIVLSGTPSAGGGVLQPVQPNENFGSNLPPYGVFDADDFAAVSASVNTVTVSLTTTQPNDLLHFITASMPYCAGVVATSSPNVKPSVAAWLVINEPTLGLTDRTPYLFKGEGKQHSWTLELRQRGQANIQLVVAAGDNYAPTRGSPVFLYEQTSAGFTLVWSGLIQDIENQYFGNNGDHYVNISAVSFESIFDTVYAEPVQYVNQTCGYILTDLFNRFENGAQVTLGTVGAGPVIALFNVGVGDKLSDLFTQLATTAEFTWGVNPNTVQLFFQAPSTIAAPFTLVSNDILWDTVNWKVRGQDYRNRQGMRLSYDAFSHSMEFFASPGGNQSFTLSRPVNQVVNCFVTLSTCNTATGAFSGQPSPGDTVTIQPATSAWQANTIYALGGVINVNGFIQKVTTAGTSGGSEPTFNTATGATTADFTVVWTCEGPAGLATGTDTYTFVSALDNTQFGEVLIGGTVAQTVQNLVDAINANAAVRNNTPNNTVSLPTWENSQCNAISVTSTGFTLQQKAAGSGWVAALSTTSSNFSWSAPFTSGGSSPNGSVGPNEGATASIQVYAAGTNSAPNSLIYTPGSNVVTLSTPLPNGSANLNIEYTRFDGDVIEVEDTALVTALAAITQGTGKYMAFSDQTSNGLIATSSAAGLQLAQQALAAYSVPPQTFTFDIYLAGLQVGMTLPVELIDPVGAGAILGSGTSPISPINWVVESIEAVLIPVTSTGAAPYLPGFGHYKYTISCVNIAQIASYLDFWAGNGGGSAAGGGGAGTASGLVATSGGAVSTSFVPGTLQKFAGAITAVAGTPLVVTHNLNTTDIASVQVFDSSSPQNSASTPQFQTTTVNEITITFGISFSGRIVITG